MDSLIREQIEENIRLKQDMLNDDELMKAIVQLADIITETTKAGHKLILCGNGGSASDALHFASEIIGCTAEKKNPCQAIVMNSDVAIMTALSNDHGYENVFAIQAGTYCQKGDVFIGISTSGNSENVYRAAVKAREKGAVTTALLGYGGGRIGSVVEHPLIVPSDDTARVQESHILIIHIICELIEKSVY